MIEKIHADDVVADAGGGDDRGEQEAEGVGDDAAFAAHDLLPASVPWVSSGTLVEVLMLCVSMMDALGSVARPW